VTTPLTAEQRKRVGPKLTVLRDCYGCAHHSSESYRVQGDSGYEHYCDHSERRHIGGSSRTPDWCPAERQAQPDAADRADELERELESVRAELDSATTRGRELVEEAEQRAEELEARVKVLEGLLGELMTDGFHRSLRARIKRELEK
jgi:hypothetical protein